MTASDQLQWRLRKQKIHPYADLLLHDMGEGLADHLQSFESTGTEWRTPTPLGNRHDQAGKWSHRLSPRWPGRARSLEEAILWHDGEATKIKEKFMQLPVEGGADLLAFLQML